MRDHHQPFRLAPGDPRAAIGGYRAKTCRRCGTVFMGRGGDDWPRYCCRRCQRSDQAARRRKLCRKASIADKMAGATCALCGKPLLPVALRTSRRYCSDLCRNRAFRARAEAASD